MRHDHPFLEYLREAPRCLAHRGASAFWPENTIEAAHAAFDMGARAWECDVQLTRDGQVVVIHDESLARTTDVERRFAGDVRAGRGFLVRDFDLTEIRSLDAGTWFNENGIIYRNAAYFGNRDKLCRSLLAEIEDLSPGIRVPTLEEALAVTISCDGFINVEIKVFQCVSGREELTAEVWNTIRKIGCENRVLVSSFDHAILKGLRNWDERLAIGLLTNVSITELYSYLRDEVGADSYHFAAGLIEVAKRGESKQSQDVGLPAQRDILERLRKKAIPGLAFTVNDAVKAAWLAHECGVSVFSDDPEAVMPAISR